VGDVRLVRVRHGDGDLAASRRVLCEEELRRAAGLSSVPARRRFVVTRAWLRALLGALHGVAPEAVRIGYGRDGKPQMLGGGQGVCFNVTHGRQVSLLAFALGREVGVDMEEVNRDNDVSAIARRFFSAAEADLLAGLEDQGERYRLFYAWWTQREALAKARGSGLNDAAFFAPLPPPGEQRRVVWLGGASWRLWSPPLAPQHAGAVALEGDGDARLSFWEVRDDGPV